jgi:hypothetical protein
MENSQKVLKDHDRPEWYLAKGAQWVGPMSASEIYSRIQASQITWVQYIWKKGQPNWKRICDVPTFQALVPKQPTKVDPKKVLSPQQPSNVAPSAPEKSKAIWFLHLNHTQFGPFSVQEVLKFLKAGQSETPVFVWCQGMPNWSRIEKVPEFQKAETSEMKPETKIEKKRKEDQRQAPRVPLVAKVLMTDEQSVIVGVCRDISIGGLQVLSDRVPANVGAKLKMNISPAGQDKDRPIAAFVAEGTVVRLLEDGRGFSFRFTALAPSAKKAIEDYFESATD